MGRIRWGWLLLLILLVACERGGQTAAGLSVTIQNPPSGARIPTGREVRINSTASSNSAFVERIELYVNGELIREDVSPTQGGQASFSVEQRWVPTEPGTVSVEVVAFDTTGRRSLPAAISLVVEGAPMVTTAPFPTRSPTSAASPTTTPFPSPSPAPSATVTTAAIEIAGTINADANLRDGPGQTFNRIGGLFAGTPVTAIGRNDAADWIQIRANNGQAGWILWSLAGWQGDIRQLPVTR